MIEKYGKNYLKLSKIIIDFSQVQFIQSKLIVRTYKIYHLLSKYSRTLFRTYVRRSDIQRPESQFPLNELQILRSGRKNWLLLWALWCLCTVCTVKFTPYGCTIWGFDTTMSEHVDILHILEHTYVRRQIEYLRMAMSKYFTCILSAFKLWPHVCAFCGIIYAPGILVFTVSKQGVCVYCHYFWNNVTFLVWYIKNSSKNYLIIQF